MTAYRKACDSNMPSGCPCGCSNASLASLARQGYKNLRRNRGWLALSHIILWCPLRAVQTTRCARRQYSSLSAMLQQSSREVSTVPTSLRSVYSIHHFTPCGAPTGVRRVPGGPYGCSKGPRGPLRVFEKLVASLLARLRSLHTADLQSGAR